MMAKGILLEAGTNEMELLIFKLNDISFGINVAKVREIIQHTGTINIPHAPDAVEGSFRLRERVMTLINLGQYFSMEKQEARRDAGMIIILEFNTIQCGILVDAVEVIHRLHWHEIEPPSPFLMNIGTPITGTVLVDGTTVLIADFETIIEEILGINGIIVPDSGEVEEKGQSTCDLNSRIIVADDSSIIRATVVRALKKRGFKNLTICCDGREVWETLQKKRSDPGGPCELVLTDIEMPQMDGLHLTAKIKDDQDFQSIPVVLFSSLITDDNARKGKAVGADAQVSKPDSSGMLRIIEELLTQKNDSTPSVATSTPPLAAAAS